MLCVLCTEVSEPLLPAPDSLLAQFTARPVFVVGDVDDDRLTASYWLTVPLPDDQDTDMQQVPYKVSFVPILTPHGITNFFCYHLYIQV